jgi:predicted DNA binding CopG/RHH family protein
VNKRLTEQELEEIHEATQHGVRVLEDPEISEMVTRMEAEADAEILGGTVTLRWGREQIGVVKRAAAIMGVPYQTYLKQVVFRQAVEDIAKAEAVLGRKTSKRKA